MMRGQEENALAPQYQSGQQWYTQSAVQTASLLSRVCYLLSTCLLATAGAAYVARDASPSIVLPCAIGALVCVFAINFTRRMPGLNLALLYGLTVLEGFALGPFLNMYTHAFANGGQLIATAFVLTAGTVGGIGAYIWVTSKDFGFLGKYLFWALIALLVVGLISMFVAGPLRSIQGQLIYCIIGAAIFVGFTLYDFSNIKLRYGPNDYVIATVQLYLDFLNIFLFLLRILAMLQGGGRSRN